MRIRHLRGWEWFVASLIAVGLILCTLPSLQENRWFGHTDLEVEFVVTDALTGESVSKAGVEIHSQGGFYEEREPQDFILTAGPNHRVSYVCRNSMCFGSRGLFKNTFVVHLPWWRFQVVADGYEPGAWIELDVPEYGRQAQWVGPGKAKLLVPVKLNKKKAEPGAALDPLKAANTCVGSFGRSFNFSEESTNRRNPRPQPGTQTPKSESSGSGEQ